jgi:hypothetical protein
MALIALKFPLDCIRVSHVRFFFILLQKVFIGSVPLKKPIISIGPMLLSVHCSAFSLTYAHKSHNFEEKVRIRDNDEMAAAKNYNTTAIFSDTVVSSELPLFF